MTAKAKGLDTMFTWVAEYLNGSWLKENKVDSNFYDIDKISIAKFYFKGPIQIGFSALSGDFFVVDGQGNSATINIKLEGDTVTEITRPTTDIIQYKDAAMLASVLGGPGLGSTVEALNIGYKWVDGLTSAKVIIKIDYRGNVTLHTTLVSAEDFEGDLVINNVRNRIKLEAGVSSTFILDIKGRCYT